MNKSKNIDVKDIKIPKKTNLLDLSLAFWGVLVDANKLSSLSPLSRLKNGFITTNFSE